MIDKNGKVFGKINIIDLIVIIVIVACIAVFGFIKLSGGNNKIASAEKKEIYMSFYAEEVPDFVAERVKEGDVLTDGDSNIELGEVTEVKVDAPKTFAADSSGKMITSEKEGYNSIIITGKVKGTLSDNGVEVGTAKYGVGHSMTLRAGDAKIYLKVYDISTK